METEGAKRRRWAPWLVVLALLAPLLGTGAFIAGGAMLTAVALQEDQTAAGPAVAASGCNGVILATIRAIESGGRYDIPPNKGGASGAYQMIDSTWRSWARSAGVDPSPYPHASDAPPGLQDAAALWKVSSFLKGGNPPEQVPVTWYIGHPITDPDDPEWDRVPMPEAGNVLTPRQYQARWLAKLAQLGGCPAGAQPIAGPPGVAPGVGPGRGIGNEPEPELADVPNGQAPLDRLVLVDALGCASNANPGCYLAPRTAAAFLAMSAEATAAGFPVRITSAYRSQVDQLRIIANVGLIAEGGLGARVGESPHGYGVAVDVDVRGVPGLYEWLVANAQRWCFGNYLAPGTPPEPWHWAWTGRCAPVG